MICDKCVHKEECGNGINLSIILDCTRFVELAEEKKLERDSFGKIYTLALLEAQHRTVWKVIKKFWKNRNAAKD